MASSNSTVVRPSNMQVEAFISNNPAATDDDIRKYMNGDIPTRPEQFHPSVVADFIGAPFMGFAKGASYGLTGKINPEYQKRVQGEHPLLYNVGQGAGMLLGGGAEIKGLQALGRTAAGVVPKIAQAVSGTGLAARAGRVAGRTAHGAASGGAQAVGEGGDLGMGAGMGGTASVVMEGMFKGGGTLAKLIGRKDYMDQVGKILNNKHQDANELLGSLTGIRKANAEQAYEKALEGRFTADREVLNILRDPDIKAAYQQFAALQREKAALGQKHILTPDAELIELYLQAEPGTAGAAAMERAMGPGIPMKLIHDMSRALRSGNTMRSAMDQNEKVYKAQVSEKVLTALDEAEDRIGKMVPEYAAADKMYASDSRAIHALNAGRGRLSPADAEGLKFAKKYAGDIPPFDVSTPSEIARWAKATREKAMAGGETAVDAARDLDHYSIGVFTAIREEVENKGKKVLARPDIRNKIAALAGNDPDAAIKFYRAVTSSKDRAAETAAAAVWGVFGHPIMAAHSARHAVSGALDKEGPDVFLNYLRQGSSDQQAIMDKIDLLRRTETYHPNRRKAAVVAAKAGGAASND